MELAGGSHGSASHHLSQGDLDALSQEYQPEVRVENATKRHDDAKKSF